MSLSSVRKSVVIFRREVLQMKSKGSGFFFFVFDSGNFHKTSLKLPTNNTVKATGRDTEEC